MEWPRVDAIYFHHANSLSGPRLEFCMQMHYFSFLAKQPYLCWLHSRLEYSSSNVCYQWGPRNIHPPHVMIVTRDTSSPSEWQVRLLGKMFEEKRTKWCLRLALWMNFISTSSNSITRDWSYFHHIWDFLLEFGFEVAKYVPRLPRRGRPGKADKCRSD